MEKMNNGKSEVYGTKVRAGKRTYFFDVKATRSNDYYITITESKRRFGGEGYDKHKIFLYKEDFNKFMECLSDTIDHVKGNLLPDYDYDEFDREPIRLDEEEDGQSHQLAASARNDYGIPEADEEDPSSPTDE